MHEMKEGLRARPGSLINEYVHFSSIGKHWWWPSPRNVALFRGFLVSLSRFEREEDGNKIE